MARGSRVATVVSTANVFHLFGDLSLAKGRDDLAVEAIGPRRIEIAYVPVAGANKPWAALLRVGAKGDLATPLAGPLPGPERNVYFDTVRDEVYALIAEEGDGAVAWIGEPKVAPAPGSNVIGDALDFRGLALLDQRPTVKQNLPLRLPLRPAFNLTNATGKPVEHVSRLWLRGDADLSGEQDYLFEIDLGVPTPVPIGGTAGGDPVLAMRLAYHADRRPDELLDPHRANFGITGGVFDTDPDALGTFGFSTHPSVGNPSASNPRFYKYGTAQGSLSKNFGPRLDLALERLGYGKHDATVPTKNNPINIEFGSSTQGGGGPNKFAVVLHRAVALQDGGPVEKKLSRYFLDLQDQFGAQIDIGSSLDANETLRVEIEHRYEVPDPTVKTLGAPSKTPAVLRLRWRSNWKTDKPPSGLLYAGGLTEAIRLMGEARRSMIGSRSQPQSFFSAWRPGNGAPREVALIGFVAADVAALLGSDAAASVPAPLRVTLDATDGVANGKPAPHFFDQWRRRPDLPTAPFPLLVPLDNVDLAAGLPGDHDYRLALVLNRRAAEDGAEAATFRLVNGATKAVHRFEGELGALRLVAPLHDGAPVGLLDTEGWSELALGRRGRRGLDRRGVAEGQATLAVQLTLAVALARAYPTRGDVPHGNRSDRPADLLIRKEADGTPVLKGTLVLNVIERLDDRHDWHLTAMLRDRIPDDKAVAPVRETYTIISAEPFSVARVARLGFAWSGDEGGNEVANYDSDAREWRFQRRGDGVYRLTFPVAVVGEATDKPGRLEIHDPGPPVEGEVLLPVPASPTVPRTHVVDMRLGPATDLWVRASDLPRNALLPEYAVRELFRQRNDFGPGVALAGLRGELLYGLPFGLMVPSPAAGAPPPPRLAELAALMGDMSWYDPADVGAAKTAERFERLRALMAQRPERIEAWRLALGPGTPFAPATLQEGLGFALRHTALLAPPVDGAAAEISLDPRAKAPRLRVHGLPGGALWPVESRNVLALLMRQPVAEGGRLTGFAISPHGGSGEQEASFAGRQVRILSDTRNGFVQSQRVEVMGRICVHWHRAKHVVVYERTTAPSAQFHPEEDGETRSRRPVLRKIEEYIEILEPVRRYPDTATAAPRAPGCIEEIRFNSRIIPVDAAWGGDVGNIGWQVPLWNRAAAERRPGAYPCPDVSFCSTGEAGDGEALVAQECLDPDHLYFFADTAVGGDDTDAWPARQGLDFSALGRPKPVEDAYEDGAVPKALDPNEPKGIEEKTDLRKGKAAPRRRPPPRLLPGFRRFTWRLAPAAARVRVNARRGDKPIYAGLESVTLMRAPGALEIGKATDDAIKNRLGAALAAQSQAVDALPPWSVEGATGGAQLTDLAELITGFLSAKDDATFKNLQDRLKEIAKGSGGTPYDSLAAGIKEVLPEKALETAQSLKTALKDVPATPADCDRMIGEIDASLKGRMLLIAETVRSIQDDLIAQVRAAPDVDAPAIKEIKEKARTALKRELDRLLGHANFDLGQLDGATAVARAILDDWRAESARFLTLARQRLAEARAAYEKGKPGSDGRLDAALAALSAEIDGVADEAGAALEEARQRLAVELGAGAAALTAAIGRAVAVALKQSAAGQRQFDLLNDLLARKAKAARATLASVVAALGKGIADLEAKLPDLKGDVLARAEGVRDALVALRGAVVALDARLSTASAKFEARTAHTIAELNELHEATTDLVDLIGTTVATVEKAIADGLDTAQDLVAEIMDSLKGALSTAIGTAAAALVRPAFDDALDEAVAEASRRIVALIDSLDAAAKAGLDALDGWLAGISKAKKDAVSNLEKGLVVVVDKAVEAAVARLPTDLPEDLAKAQDAVAAALQNLADGVVEAIAAAGSLLDVTDSAQNLCKQLVGLKDAFLGEVAEHAKSVQAWLEGAVQDVLGFDPNDYKEADAAVEALKGQLTQAVHDVEASLDHAKAYADGVVEAAAKLTEGPVAGLPNAALGLYAAATQAPEIAALKAAADRLRLTYDEVADRIGSTQVAAAFARLGDALKGLGLDFKFDGLSDALDIKSLTPDLRRLIPNLGGLDLSRMLPDVAAPERLADHLRITHDLDKEAGRAWVQVDLDLPLKGRTSLFSIGPFTLYLRDAHLKATVRYEASKDTETVQGSDRATLTTDLEAVVAGQVMVSLGGTRIEYRSGAGLDVHVDPKRIRLNPTLQFVQDTLGDILGDEIGAFRWIKENGVPVGMEQEFAMPPISLMYGTSGISNLAISNNFSLRAFPDFVISDRFGLSRRDLPFLFTIFIIGGTGYVRIEAEYRPFDDQLSVLVEVGLGGSAALGFAFGPVSGAVFISLSIALTYERRIGTNAGGGGLTVSLVLVIAGHVSLWGMVTIYLGLTLTMSYRESGRIDATGTLRVELRISKFFKLKYATTVSYKLRDGKATKQVTSTVETGGDLQKALDKAKKLEEARRSL